jgi:hypothetical protein
VRLLKLLVLMSACGRHDIGWSYLPCNNQSQTYKIYHWIRDCNSNASEAVSLPRPEGPFRCVGGCVEGWYRPFGNATCVPCPPGQYFVPTGSCQLCPNGTYSDTAGALQCKLCPQTTFPSANRTDCEASCLLPVPPLVINNTTINTTGLFYNLTDLGAFPTYVHWTLDPRELWERSDRATTKSMCRFGCVDMCTIFKRPRHSSSIYVRKIRIVTTMRRDFSSVCLPHTLLLIDILKRTHFLSDGSSLTFPAARTVASPLNSQNPKINFGAAATEREFLSIFNAISSEDKSIRS